MACEAHHLATAPDGLCVLCRHERERTRTRRHVLVASATLGVGVALVAAVALARRALAVASAMRAHPTEGGEASGRWHMAEPAPPPSTQAGTEAALHESARAMVRITIYSADWCPHCRRAKSWLAAQRLSYFERNVERDAGAERALWALNPRGGLPTIDVDGKVLVGFEPRQVQAAVDAAIERRLGRP